MRGGTSQSLYRPRQSWFCCKLTCRITFIARLFRIVIRNVWNVCDGGGGREVVVNSCAIERGEVKTQEQQVDSECSAILVVVCVDMRRCVFEVL